MKYTTIRHKVAKKGLGGVLELAEIIGGFVPGLSEITDVIGIARGLLTGNTLDTAISAVGLITPGVSGAHLKAAKQIASHSDEIMAAVKTLKKEDNIIEQPLKRLKNRVEDASKTKPKKSPKGESKSKVGSKAFKEHNVDTRNSVNIQDGFYLDERGIIRDEWGQIVMKVDPKTGKQIIVNPNYLGYNPNQMLEDLHGDMLNPASAKNQILTQLAENNPVARRTLESAQELDKALRTGSVKDLPKINNTFLGDAKAGHLVIAKNQLGNTSDNIYIAGYHAERPWTPGITVRTSGSGNMNFAGDTPASVLAYQQLDLDYAKKQAGKLIGNAKKEANDAIEFIEEFEKLYPKTWGKLPAAAYTDEQFGEYVKASQIVSLASGHDPKVGRMIPVIFQAPSKNNIITVDGKEIAAFDDLSGASITWGGQQYRTGQLFETLGRSQNNPSGSLDLAIAEDISKKVAKRNPITGQESTIKAQWLKDTYNRTLSNGMGITGALLPGMKSGGKLNYFNY